MSITRVNALTALEAASGASVADFVYSLSGLTISSGDVLLLGVNGSSTADRTLTIAGNNGNAWTKIADLYANDSEDCNVGVFISQQGSTPDTSVTVSGNGTSNFGAAQVLQYRGVDSTTQQDVVATTATGINGNLADPPSITPVTSGAKIIAFYFGTNPVGTSTAWTAPGNLSNWAAHDYNNASDATMKIGSGDADWTSGAFDPAAVTGGGSAATDSWAAVTIALRPAASTGVTGTVAATESADTASASGSVAVTGTAAAAEASDTVTASGSLTVAGTVARTEANDTTSASGSVSVAGSTGATETNDAASASGAVTISGSIAATEAADTASGSGTVASAGITGTASIAEADDVSAIVGALIVSGSVTAQEVADIAFAEGDVPRAFRFWQDPFNYRPARVGMKR